ncbi:MerR family DNA-binding transcriptional regulator [Nocardia nova]
MGRAADMLGTPQAFLRSLDEAKLITPQRSAGGHRRYSRYQLRIAARARELPRPRHTPRGGLPDHHPRRPTRRSPRAQTPNSPNKTDPG